MTQFAQYILAMMLALISPGQSTYSRVALQSCDAQCQKTPLCANKHSWFCKPPVFDQQLYNNAFQMLKSQGLSDKAANEAAKLKSFTRPETYEEGLARYVVIAQAIADVSEENTRHICNERCKNKSSVACHQSCTKTSPWLWSRADLALAIATVTNQESGYRADVHGGVGTMGRGDCRWRFSNGKPASPYAKGAAPVSGSCRSVCLGQINLGKGTTPGGFKAGDLVGVDYGSTKRCLTVVARYLSRSRLYCTRWKKPSNWARATFTSYGTGATCVAYKKRTKRINGKAVAQYAYKVKKDNGKISIEWGSVPPDNAVSKTPLLATWANKRAGIFSSYLQLYRRKKLVLTPKVQTKLTDNRVHTLVEKLMQSPTAITWMVPISP